MLWKGFQKPKRLEVNEETLTSTYGEFASQPYERGFATTIGNTLRRVLLSSIEGAAITAVKIDGVVHEFSSVEGVTEDVTDLILNLKAISMKITNDEVDQTVLTLDSKSPGKVTAKDIRSEDGTVEILNPDAHVATLAKGGKLKMEMRVKRARGYVTAEANFDEDLEFGYIPIDSVHSPAKKVNFAVTAARLGRTTDYEKLTIEVWTNGAISPQSAVALASKLTKDHFNIFINFKEEPEGEGEDTGEEKDKLTDYLSRSIEELELSVRSYNCLKNANISTIGELVSRTEQEMLKTKNFGRKSLNEIKEILEGMGLNFGMSIQQPEPPAGN
ncbi:MAG TPA: DNA-directed RNA polymerase subunit alpha [Acidobacteriota bacterium]|nr:DNA-directed RNA polymerase subunit alpha [Acidobacteriota bacterium]